jgi:N-acetylglutamate synthase-like GNAT family acetyltransferase
MNENSTRTYPMIVSVADEDYEVRYMTAADGEVVSRFAHQLPPHDLLFMRRDITEPKVLAAWLKSIEDGSITTLLALQDGQVRGCIAIIRDELSWSPHVGEMRIVVDAAKRGKGLGRVLMKECFPIAVELAIEKLTAYMTADQAAAIALFEELGFRPEAVLSEHVQDRDGTKFDVVMLSHNVNKFLARIQLFGGDQPV